MNAQPFYLVERSASLLAQVHRPSGASNGIGVVFCPPWGWEEAASYRVRGLWAQHLAERGASVLRLDLPGTGDSDGDPADGDQVARWVGALRCATDQFAGASDLDRVTAIGFGLGGLLMMEAVASGAPVTDAVLWATHPSGRRFTRALRAFAGTQSARFSLSEVEPTSLPDGWLEVNGFILHAETVAAISDLDATRMPTGSVRRALLFDQDGLAVDDALISHLRASNVDVTVGVGHGWANMTSHPERCELPSGVIGQVDQWVETSASTVPSDHVTPLVRAGSLVARIAGGTVTESPVSIGAPGACVFAIAAEPAAPSTAKVCAVFLNAGAVRRIGPNRLWVTAARKWAAAGVPSLRVDLSGIGDGSGEEPHPASVASLYESGRYAEVTATIDEAERRWPDRQVVVVGLCVGAYWAFRAAQEDRRVSDAVLFNTGALIWDEDLVDRRRAGKLARIADPVWIRRVLRGDVRWELIRDSVRSAGVLAAGYPKRVLRRGRRDMPESHSIVEALDRVAVKGSRLVLAFSDDEVVADQLEGLGLIDQLDRWPNIEHRRLPGRDHTLRPVVAQLEVLQILDEVVHRASSVG